MKKIICIIGVLIMLFSLSGCSLAEARLRELTKSSVSEAESMKKVEDTVIQALETKDVELLKSIFSEKALSQAADFDRGVAYLFNLYQGNFVEIVYENHSADGHMERNKSTKCISAWCNIKTTVTTYTLSWVEWTKQEADPSAKGVYNLQMTEYDENDTTGYWSVAGINYPERNIVHDAISGFVDAFYDKQREAFISVLSTNLLNREETNNQVDRLSEILKSFIYSDKGDAWVTYDQVGERERMNVYMEVEIYGESHHREPYMIYFNYDAEEKDKISVFELVKEESQIDPDLSCGIYLPE